MRQTEQLEIPFPILHLLRIIEVLLNQQSPLIFVLTIRIILASIYFSELDCAVQLYIPLKYESIYKSQKLDSSDSALYNSICNVLACNSLLRKFSVNEAV